MDSVSKDTGQPMSQPMNLPVLKDVPTEVLFRVSQETKPLVLECALESGDRKKLKYKWRKNGQPFNLFDNPAIIQRENEGTLVLLRPAASDEGSYQCLAESQYGVASSRVFQVRRAFIEAQEYEVQRHEVAVRSILILECPTFKAYPKPNIEWTVMPVRTDAQADPIPVEKLDDPWITVGPDGALYFSSVTKKTSDHFKYICQARSPAADQPVILAEHFLTSLSEEEVFIEEDANEEDAIEEDAIEEDAIEEDANEEDANEVDANEEDAYKEDANEEDANEEDANEEDANKEDANEENIKEQDAKEPGMVILYTSPDTVARVEESLYLYCINGGEPLAHPRWFRDGKYINNDPDHRVTHRNGSCGKRLLFRGVLPEDEGTYKSVVDDWKGTILEHEIKLTVVAAPKFTKRPEKIIYLKEGDDVTISYEVSGLPAPKLTYTYNAASLNKSRVAASGLTIKEVQRSDSGYYGCCAANEYGSDYVETLLIVT